MLNPELYVSCCKFVGVDICTSDSVDNNELLFRFVISCHIWIKHSEIKYVLPDGPVLISETIVIFSVDPIVKGIVSKLKGIAILLAGLLEFNIILLAILVAPAFITIHVGVGNDPLDMKEPANEIVYEPATNVILHAFGVKTVLSYALNVNGLPDARIPSNPLLAASKELEP